MQPRVTVAVVTRDRADSLERTLRALRELDYPSFEILAVDNDSSDRTPDLLRELADATIFVPSARGIGFCRRTAVERASGEIVAFLDDDCVPVRSWLSHHVRRLQANPRLGLVGGRVVNIGFGAGKENKGLSRLDRNGTCRFVEAAEADFYGNENLAFRREIVLSIGNYDPFFNVMAEIDLQTRLKRAGFETEYAPEASVEHHYTGRSLKRRHVFQGPELVRLYFFFKNHCPRGFTAWRGFAGYEWRLLKHDLRRAVRSAGAGLFHRREGMFRVGAVDLLNSLAARFAIPWLLWRTRPARRQLVLNGETS